MPATVSPIRKRTRRSAVAPVSARKAILAVLQNEADRPMTARELVDRVVSYPGVQLHGSTPRATVQARLAELNARGAIAHPARGLYALRGRGRRLRPRQQRSLAA